MTGEGRLDGPSFEGKVVGGVLADSTDLGVPVVAIVGQASADAAAIARTKTAELVVLSERFGLSRAMGDAAACVEEVAGELLPLRSTE